MRQALPNGCFLGFTGTPIDKKDRSTLRTFGSYIDTYTIEQAVQDKATVPIFYESRLADLQIIGQTIDQVFDRVFADRSEEERAAIKRRFATEQEIACAPRRIEAVCLDLIEHFNRFIAPNGFKAQVVATSRNAAVSYKETLDRLNGPESALIMSAGHNDEERLTRWHLRKNEQDAVIDRFKDRDDPLAMLVVCDMLLTGFDAPVEQVMYLDAPLKEHTLLQAIARVNRPGEEKTYGLVVDYWGVSAKLQEALDIFSTTEIQGALTPSVDELPRLQSRHAAAMRFFQAVADTDDLDACVRVLEPEDVRAEFDLAFRRFSQSMDMLLPDQRALAYHADLRWLGKIRGTARARYRDDRLDLSGCGEKVRQLIADAVAADGIEILVQEVQLFSPEFDEKVEALQSDEAKASEMEHVIRHEISVRVEENPAFYQSLRQRLEEIIAQRRLERLDAAQQLSLLNSLREELKGEQTQAQDIGLEARGFAIYGLLKEGRPIQAGEKTVPYEAANRELASLIDEAVAPFTDLVDWHQKEDVQREMRSKIKRLLRAGGIAPGAVDALAVEIVDLAKVRTRAMTGSLETSAVTWGDTRLTYAIRRSPRRKKTVAVTVDPVGGVLLVAPEQFSTSRLDSVVRRKAGWIVQRLQGVESNGAPPSPREFVSGESVMYLGRHYRLKVEPGETGEAKLRGAWLHVPAPAGEGQRDQVKEGLVAWLRGHAAERLPERVEMWRPKVGVEMPEVVISDQKRRVGELRPERDDSAELAHHPGTDAAGGLRGGPRVGAPAAPRPRARLLAGLGEDYARL